MNSVEQKQLQINNRNFNSNTRLSEVVADSPKYSQLDLSHSHFTTFDSGFVVPIAWEEVLPGDIFKIHTSGIIRMSAPASNTMANPILSINAFFVSYVSIWDKWKKLMGDTGTAGPDNNITRVPILDFANNTVEDLSYKEGDLAAYLGFPIYKPLPSSKTFNNTQKVNALMFAGYGHICNNWYINENFDDSINISFLEKDGFDVKFEQYNPSMDYHESIRFGFGLCPANKLPDYFTTCLAEQQRGPNLSISPFKLEDLFIHNMVSGSPEETKKTFVNFKFYGKDGNGLNFSKEAPLGLSKNGYLQYTTNNPTTQSYDDVMVNLGVKSKGNPAPFYVPDLRDVLTIQHYFELDNRFGTRYNEFLFAHWGIQIDPLDIGKPVLIGGWEDSLKISNVVQTSSNTESSPLGAISGVLQNSFDVPVSFDYASTDYGIIYVMAVIRTPIYYSQGLSAKWTRTDKFDFFDHLFENVSDMPVYNQELYYDNSDGKNKDGFGFNEPWASYRYSKNLASGFMSVNSPQSLSDLYLYQQKYTARPSLNKQFNIYDPNIIRNTLLKYDTSNLEFYHQFIANFNFDIKVDRKIALYGTPGVKYI